MTYDQIIKKIAISIAQDWPGGLTVSQALQHARSALAVAEPLILDQAKDDVFLLSVIADIREKSGLGDGPMLTELADAIKAKIDGKP